MLFILFRAGKDRYALDANLVREVLPLVALKAIPNAPSEVAGVFDYRGQPVPVIDLGSLLVGTPARASVSTRLVLVHYPDGDAGTYLGLIAEAATRFANIELDAFAQPGVRPDGTPYLGPVASDAQGLVQWVHPSALLTPALRNILFPPEVAS